MLDKKYIVELLKTNDKAVIRALIVINQRQTEEEKNCEGTINLNGQGFTPADAFMGTRTAEFAEKRGYLTEKQLNYWRKPNVKGTPRICKYAGQLLEIAKSKTKSVA